jgi:hypothetical protein
MKNAVSLLPAEYRGELEKQRKLASISKKLTVAMAVVLMVAAVLFGVRMFADGRVSRLSDQRSEVNAQVSSMSSVRQLYQQQQSLRSSIAKVESTDPRLIGAVSALSGCLPDGVWMESFTTAQGEDGSYTCTISCGAANNAGAGQTLANLSENEWVSSAVCSQTASSNEGVVFTLTVVLHTPSEQ